MARQPLEPSQRKDRAFTIVLRAAYLAQFGTGTDAGRAYIEELTHAAVELYRDARNAERLSRYHAYRADGAVDEEPRLRWLASCPVCGRLVDTYRANPEDPRRLTKHLAHRDPGTDARCEGSDGDASALPLSLVLGEEL